MLNNINIGRYYPVKSKVHEMHPLSKILCTVIFIIMLLLCSNIKITIALTLLTLLLTEMAHIPYYTYLKNIISLKFLLLFIIIINLLLKNSIESIIIIILKTISIVEYTCILTLTTPPTEITYGLELFLKPLSLIKVPVNRIALTITLAIRFIPTIIDQGNKILKSQASRGIDYYNSGIKGKLIAIKSMLFPMFILTIKRADQLAETMELRLYSIDKKRTNFRINNWSFFDTYMTLIHFILLYLIVSQIFQ